MKWINSIEKCKGLKDQCKQYEMIVVMGDLNAKVRNKLLVRLLVHGDLGIEMIGERGG